MRFVDTSQVNHLAADLAAAPAKVTGRSGRAVSASTRLGARIARELVPVDTSELLDSIHVETHGLVGEVVAGTDHAEYVEDGTSDMAPQPFMRPALSRASEGLVHDLEDIIGDFL